MIAGGHNGNRIRGINQIKQLKQRLPGKRGSRLTGFAGARAITRDSKSLLNHPPHARKGQ
jgi:hypothetical protein